VNAVFDTNIVIDALNGVSAADAEYSRYTRVLISRITWMEVLVGAQGNDAQVRDFLETQFEIIPLDLAVAERAVESCGARITSACPMPSSGQQPKSTMPSWSRAIPRISTPIGRVSARHINCSG